MALSLPPPVDASFVKATTNSITLEFALTAASQTAVEKYELQYRPASSSTWTTASSTLKTKRCTKGNLSPGSAYYFRARASSGGERWGPFGNETAQLYTKLPDLPDTVSESLKVPAKVIAAATEAAAEKALKDALEREANEARRLENARREQQIQQDIAKAEENERESEKRCKVIVSASLSHVVSNAEKELERAAVEADKDVRAMVDVELRDEEAAAVDALLKKLKVSEMLEGPSPKVVAQMQQTKNEVRSSLGKKYADALAIEVDKSLMVIESDLDQVLLQGLREAREQATKMQAAERHENEAHDVTAQRHALEAGLLDAVQSARLSFSASAAAAANRCHGKEEEQPKSSSLLDEVAVLNSRYAKVLDKSLGDLHMSVARSLELTEQRLLRRQQASVLEAWMMAEALRSRSDASTLRDAALAQREKFLSLRRNKLQQLQELFSSDSFTEEAKAKLTAEADMARTQAEEAEAEAAALFVRIESSRSPWLEIEDDHADGGQKSAIPKSLLPDVFVLTSTLPESSLQAAMERAVASVHPLQVQLLHQMERTDLVRKAVETVVVEAVHWSKLKQQQKARADLSALSEAKSAEIVAVQNESEKRVAQLIVKEPSEPVIEVKMDSLIKSLLDKVKAYMVHNGVELDVEAGLREVVAGVVKQVEHASMEAQRCAVADARRSWDSLREAERRMEIEKSQKAVQQAIENSMEGRQHMIQQSIDEAVQAAENRLKLAHAEAMCEAIRQTTMDTRAACEAEIKAASQEGFERGKTTTRMQADRATVAKARSDAIELVRQEMGRELDQAKEAAIAAANEVEKLRVQLEQARTGSAQAAAQAAARAVQLQRAATEAAMAEQTRAEVSRLEAKHKMDLELKLAAERARAEKELRCAVEDAREKEKARAVAQAQNAVKLAAEEARRAEALAQQAIMQKELRAAHATFHQRAKEDTRRAVAAALEAHVKQRVKEVESQAVQSIIGKSDSEKKQIEASAALQVQMAIAHAEERHKKQQADAVAKAVREATEHRKVSEERAVQQRVSAAVEMAKRKAEAEFREVLIEREAEVKRQAAKELVEAVQAAKEKTMKEALERIKPQLQKQEAVEAAIRDAEERAREKERHMAAQIQARIEERAADASSQPAAVQAAVRAAVRESEERAEQRLAAVHKMYEKAAAEQQIQIKELLQTTQREAKERHQTLLASAIREVRERAEEEKQVALEQARMVVQSSAVQQAEQLDALLSELAEVRAENLRLTSEMEARTKDLAEIASMSAMYDIGEGNTEVMTQVYSGEHAPTAAHVYTGDQSLLTISNNYNDGPYSPVSSLPYDENLSAVASTVPVNAVEKAVEGRLQHNEFDDDHNQSAATLSAAKPFPLSHHLD
ncbi:hypothetical protein AB1Y20_013592 [Prymnesium parvum]|uniref:Fibronectin type-III domain-containing protein n=1 Tax=Prymnesium parvum TaxID=97485 RepID=A0AB34IJ12_PRYPA